MVSRLPFYRDEGFEAGVAPELCSDARHARRRDSNPANISVEAEGQMEFTLADRRTRTSMARTVSGRVDGWHLRSIQCSTVITGSVAAAGLISGLDVESNCSRLKRL